MKVLNSSDNMQVSGGTANNVLLLNVMGLSLLTGIGMFGVVLLMREEQKTQQAEKTNLTNLTPQEAYDLGYKHAFSTCL
jgi:hypothetical protein